MLAHILSPFSVGLSCGLVRLPCSAHAHPPLSDTHTQQPWFRKGALNPDGLPSDRSPAHETVAFVGLPLGRPPAPLPLAPQGPASLKEPGLRSCWWLRTPLGLAGSPVPHCTPGVSLNATLHRNTARHNIYIKSSRFTETKHCDWMEGKGETWADLAPGSPS